MKREWRHEVSEKWLEARRICLTASDIKNLITDYKRIKAGKITVKEAQQFAKVYGAKQQTNFDTESYGAMARGHIMEPYAVSEYNTMATTAMHWWDDRLIVNGALGFSPDALDREPMPGVITRVNRNNGFLFCLDNPNFECLGPQRMLEIKSYEAGAHFQRKMAVASDIKLDERWQVACAMVVCATIQYGTLMFYAPQCNDWFTVNYDREDLKEEIDIILEIEKLWIEFRKAVSNVGHLVTTKTENEIYSLYLLDVMSS